VKGVIRNEARLAGAAGALIGLLSLAAMIGYLWAVFKP